VKRDVLLMVRVAGCKQDLDVVTGCNIDSNTGLKDELGRVDGFVRGNAALAGIFSRIHVAITTSFAGTCCNAIWSPVVQRFVTHTHSQGPPVYN